MHLCVACMTSLSGFFFGHMSIIFMYLLSPLLFRWVYLKNKENSSLYAMKWCSAGEGANGKCHIGAIVENSGPFIIYIHYVYIPEYISISQDYRRDRISIVYKSQCMDP